MKIVWHKLVDFPGYSINRLGQIKNEHTGRILKPYDDSRGYLRVTLYGKNHRVHLLVAKQFIPNPNNLPIVNHKNGNKSDPRASNLEYVSQSENIKHAWKTGLIRRKHGRRKKL